MGREEAVEKVRENRLTLRQVADEEGLAYVEVYELAAAAGIDVGYTEADLRRDVDRI